MIPDRKGTGRVDRMRENGATVGRKPAGSGGGEEELPCVEDESLRVAEKTF